jgi:non-lysosomal glucosylceramidase
MKETRGKLLFPKELPECRFMEFSADGFTHPVAGVVYRGGRAVEGMPLGGLGTGYISLNTDGTLGKCTIFNTWPKPRELNSPFLALVLDSEIRVLTLKPPEGLKGVSDICYWGHYPFADLQYVLDLPLEVSLRAFTPFVPGDVETSNTPAIVFKTWLTNTGDKPLSGCLALIFPGPTPHEGETFTRIELTDKEDNLAGVEVKHGKEVGYAIGVIHPRTAVKHGAALGTEAAPWTSLNREMQRASATHPGATLALDFKIMPGAETNVNFVLAWFYPYFRDSDGMPHEHRYLTRFKSPADVARFVAANSDDMLRRSLAWQEVIYRSELPLWLKDALINSLYSLAKNTIWIYSDRPDDWWGPMGFFTHSESFTGCPITETIVCRFHGHFPILFFFPELELTTLNGFAHYQLKTGEIPFSFGKPIGFTRPHYYCQHPLNSSEYVQTVYRYYCRTGDEAFLRRFFPSVKDAIYFAKGLDTDADGLVNEHPHAPQGEDWPANQFYDIWPWHGTSAYVAGIWLATLKIAEDMAKKVGDMAFAKDCRVWFDQGRRAFEEKLWNGRYYRLYNDPEGKRVSEVCLANQLMGEWCTRIVGLDGIFLSEHAMSALDSVEALNFKATDCGIVNGCLPDGKRDTSGKTHSSEIFVGESICVAMTMIYAGRTETGLEIVRRIYESIALRHRTPWNQYCLISAEDGGPVWGSDYYSNLVIWAFPMALKGETIQTFSSAESLIGKILQAGRKT